MWDKILDGLFNMVYIKSWPRVLRRLFVITLPISIPFYLLVLIPLFGIVYLMCLALQVIIELCVNLWK